MQNKIPYFFQITRPILWLPIVTIFIIGAWLGGTDNSFESIGFIYGFIGIILISSFCYSINYISDIDIDKLSGKYLQIFDEINTNIILIYSILLSLLGLISFSLVNKTTLYLAGLIVLFGVLYSVEPMRFKKRAPLDVFSHIIGLGVLPFLVGWSSISEISTTSLYYATSIGIFIGSGYIILTIPDSEFDKKFRINTIVVKIGNKKSILISFILLLVSISFYFKIKNLFFLTYLLCLPTLVIYNIPKIYSGYVSPRVLLNSTMFFWCESLLLMIFMSAKSLILILYILFSIIIIFYYIKSRKNCFLSKDMVL